MKKGYFVHSTSEVESNVLIGKGTRIWHFCHIMNGARIGSSCNIGQNVFIDRDVNIGHHVKIQNNVSVYRGVTLEDYVFCGPSMVFTNVFNPRSAYPRSIQEYRKTKVGRGATIGANATIICGNNIGEYALIGAGSVVTKDIPSYAIAYGNPTRLKGWICQCGEKLLFKKNKTECSKCSRIYRKKGLVINKIDQEEIIG